VNELRLEVVDIVDEPGDIRTLTLARPDRGKLPSFTPGSHIVINCGAPESPIPNAYSLTGAGIDPDTYTVSVLLCPDGSGGSRWIHEQLRVGDLVTVGGPRSAFAPVLKARRHLLIAAGIGVTPMVSHLRSARTWGRDVRLLYIHREGRGAYVDEIKALTDEAWIFTDRESFYAELIPALATQPLGTHLYVCGPNAFMDQVIAAARDAGWPESRIHLERFGIDALDPGEPFEVRLASTGETFTVESGVSLLEALEKRGHKVPNLCRQGVCGECRIPVSAGEIEHRDLYLTDEDKAAGDAMMCCVSRAAGDRLELAL